MPDDPPSGHYAYLETNLDGSPVTFSPCRAIHYVIHDPAGVGEAGRDAVARAASEMSLATGLAFVFDGYTDEAPSRDRALTMPQYDAQWAPVLIAWSDPEETPGLEGSIVGLGGGRPARARDGGLALVSGSIELDSPTLIRMLGRAAEASRTSRPW